MKQSNAHERMIEAALELFHLQGVNATSIDQILTRSDTGKSQFTHYFKTKEGLVHAVLQYLHEVIKSGKTPTGYNVKTWDNMYLWFDKYIDFQKSVSFKKSCPIGTIGNDITQNQNLLRQDVRLFHEWSHGQLARFFAERKAANELKAEANPDELADFCIAVMQGGMLLTKIHRDPATFQSAKNQALNYITSLRKT